MIFMNQDKSPATRYTEPELMARLKFIIGIALALTLTGIVFVVLYSIIFVVQPLGAISPIDTKFFELIIPIATFLTGTLSGIMLSGASKEDKEFMMEAHKKSLENFEDTKKAMLNPVVQPVSASVRTPRARRNTEQDFALEPDDPQNRCTRND